MRARRFVFASVVLLIVLSVFAINGCGASRNRGITLAYGQIDVTNLHVLIEFFNELTEALTREDIRLIKNAEPDDFWLFHFGLGLWIRNNWLWSPRVDCMLAETILELDPSLRHPDNMSSFLIVAYHHYLNGLPFSVELFREFFDDDY